MRYRTMLLTAILSLLAGGLVLPQDVRPGASAHEVHDEDQARQALENGEIVPLDRVMAWLGDAVPGEVSAVELERENEIWIYEFKVIAPDGRMLYVRVNAKTGQLIGKSGN